MSKSLSKFPCTNTPSGYSRRAHVARARNFFASFTTNSVRPGPNTVPGLRRYLHPAGVEIVQNETSTAYPLGLLNLTYASSPFLCAWETYTRAFEGMDGGIMYAYSLNSWSLRFGTT